MKKITKKQVEIRQLFLNWFKDNNVEIKEFSSKEEAETFYNQFRTGEFGDENYERRPINCAIIESWRKSESADIRYYINETNNFGFEIVDRKRYWFGWNCVEDNEIFQKWQKWVNEELKDKIDLF